MTPIPSATEQPTMPVWPVLGEVFGKGRSTVLELARRAANGDQYALPVRVYRIGRGYRVATAELRHVLGLDLKDANGAPARAPLGRSVSLSPSPEN